MQTLLRQTRNLLRAVLDLLEAPAIVRTTCPRTGREIVGSLG